MMLEQAMRETVKAWASYVGLVSVFVVSNGSMTLTLTERMNALEHRMDRLAERIEARMDRVEAKMDRIETKIDTVDEKFDQLLIALAGRGVIRPAKPERKDLGAEK